MLFVASEATNYLLFIVSEAINYLLFVTFIVIVINEISFEFSSVQCTPLIWLENIAVDVGMYL